MNIQWSRNDATNYCLFVRLPSVFDARIDCYNTRSDSKFEIAAFDGVEIQFDQKSLDRLQPSGTVEIHDFPLGLDGTVNISDLLAIVDVWGPCT